MGNKHRAVPRNNPLAHEEPQVVAASAARFWKTHHLTTLVSQQEFELGALVFRNLDDALAEIDQGSAPPARFAILDNQQKESITAYIRRYNRKGNRVKLAVFNMVDALIAGVHAIANSWRNRKSEDNVRPDVASVPQPAPTNRTTKSKWEYLKDLSPAQLQILMTCIMAAVTQGWDQASMNGANLGWPSTFGVPLDSFSDHPTDHPIIIFSLLNAAPWFSGALFAFFVSDPIQIGGG
ncbi:hypothetical protein BDV96DRAFT_641918 [Lophiotrema nucula]|uniref:Uncharacterized protein n=1 Tax=Lophiotrema nucula TaxID=690887 RepID=A0A6A5ZPA6_9PLEO|nr:hypothetical protein BDV96DRAFT_641918 [Lophiotrema nucula]